MLKPLALHLLLALGDRASHGYALMQAIRAQSADVRVTTASFYRHLAKLLDDGLVAEAAGPDVDDPRRGAYYRITARGRQALAAERKRLAALVAQINKLRLHPRKAGA
jgi:PadR family transcriptional regulator, regulatory protein PadR